MTRLLVSVRDEAEAETAHRAGADFIDLKNPAAGALGGLAPERVAAIVRVLRALGSGRPVSATIGDLGAERLDEILARVEAVARCGVDMVKVGVARSGQDAGPAEALLRALARCGVAIVPVLLADEGLDDALVEAALREDAFPSVMLDTAAKGAGSLVQRLPRAALADFVARIRASGRLAGLAGALRVEDVPALRQIDPDFAGFRSAVCVGGRAGVIDAGCVHALSQGLAHSGSGLRPDPGIRLFGVTSPT